MCTPLLPSSPIPGASVIPDSIVMSDDDLNALDDLLGSEVAGSAVDVQPVELSYHRDEEI